VRLADGTLLIVVNFFDFTNGTYGNVFINVNAQGQHLTTWKDNISRRVALHEAATGYSQTSKVAGSSDFCIEKFSTAQSLESKNCISLPGTTLHLRQRDLNGNFVISGLEGQAAYLAKVDSVGNLLWEHTYKYAETVGANHDFRSFDFLDSNKICAGGFISEATGFKIWLLTLDENGCYNGNCGSEIVIPKPTSSIPLVDKSNTFKLWPNPCKEGQPVSIALEHGNLDLLGGQVRIYNSIGQLVTSVNEQLLSSVSLPAGLYRVVLLQDAIKAPSSVWLVVE
jgi:hypothetical protein